MSKETLKIGVDLGTEKDEQCAVINLHYNGIDHIIYETHDKEQVGVLNRIMCHLEAIDNSNPSEALECLEEIKSQSPVCHYDDGSKSYVFEKEFDTIKQALLKAEQDKKKLNEIEKLTHLLYSERRKIGQEYVKWCKENNTVFNDETNMITWVLAIKLKECLKNE